LRDTHESTTDPEARLYQKSRRSPSLPSYIGHVLTENRNGLVVAALATQSSSRAEREAAIAMLDRMRSRAARITLGADKGYQNEQFVQQLRARQVVPHVAEYEPNPKWPSFLTDEERLGEGFRISQRKRKLIEKVFAWAKLDRSLRQVKVRGLRRVDWVVQLLAAAHNLRRMQTLLATP
jgi:hypothetical protein